MSSRDAHRLTPPISCSDTKSDKENSKENVEVGSSVGESIISKTEGQLQSQETLQEECSAVRQLNDSLSSFASVCGINDHLDQKMETEADSDLRQSPPPVPLRKAVFSDSSPYNSVSGQRGSKGLASSIRRGARKKTLRKLDLPEPGELGIALPKDHLSNESDSDYMSEGCTQDTSLAVAKVLQRSSSIAAAVVAVREEQQIPVRESSDKQQSERKLNKEREDEVFEDELPLCASSEIKCHLYSDKNMMNNNTKSVIKESQVLNKISMQKINKHTHLNLSVMEIQKEKNGVIEDYDRSRIGYNSLDSDHQDRRQILEEKMAESLRITKKLNTSQSRPTCGLQPLMSAEMRQRAQERWNNKLASLTLQTMQRPTSSSARAPFSYNLLSSPTTPSLPTHLHKHKTSSEE